MLISKGVNALRLINKLPKNRTEFQAIRNHTWSYRQPPLYIKSWTADIIQGTAWWWVLWHLWTEPGHIYGEFEYPDARKWTDAELGIPEELEIDEE